MKKRDTKESVLSKLDELSGSQGELLVSSREHTLSMLSSSFHGSLRSREIVDESPVTRYFHKW